MARGPSLAERFGAAARRLPGVSEHPSQFAPVRAWWIDGREFAHLREGTLSVRLTRREIAVTRHRLVAEPRVTLNRSEWVDVRLRVATDLPLAREIFRAAAEANRRRPGETKRLTPDDRSLARRRRLHGASTEELED